jgi:hypothetical protein
MEEEGQQKRHYMGETMNGIAIQVERIFKVFYKKVADYVKDNTFTESQITILKHILGQMYALKCNKLIYNILIWPKIMNFAFLISYSMVEEKSFSPKTLLWFLPLENDDFVVSDLSDQDEDLRNALKDKMENALFKNGSTEYENWLETDTKEYCLDRKIWFLSQSLLIRAPFTHFYEDIEALLESIISDIQGLRTNTELDELNSNLKNFDKENFK